MNEIIKKELKNELTYEGTIILTYKIEYPEITSSYYKFGSNIFNQYNKTKAIQLENYITNQLFKDAIEIYEYNTSQGFPVMVFEVIQDYTITYNKDFIVSLYSDNYELTGGAHGSTVRTAQNWDLRLGRSIPLSYFFQGNPYYIIDILKNINSQISSQLQLNPSQYFDNYCELVLDTFNLKNYYITSSNNIVIFFQQYDIAPYSSGIPTFYIPILNDEN
jgi:hypothetical protein